MIYTCLVLKELVNLFFRESFDVSRDDSWDEVEINLETREKTNQAVFPKGPLIYSHRKRNKQAITFYNFISLIL